MQGLVSSAPCASASAADIHVLAWFLSTATSCHAHEFHCRTNLACPPLQAALEWLAAQPSVHWVVPRPRVALHNFLGTGICQSGGAGGVNLAAGTTSGGNATHPIWLAGLQVPCPEHLAYVQCRLFGVQANLRRDMQGDPCIPLFRFHATSEACKAIPKFQRCLAQALPFSRQRVRTDML